MSWGSPSGLVLLLPPRRTAVCPRLAAFNPSGKPQPPPRQAPLRAADGRRGGHRLASRAEQTLVPFSHTPWPQCGGYPRPVAPVALQQRRAPARPRGRPACGRPAGARPRADSRAPHAHEQRCRLCHDQRPGGGTQTRGSEVRQDRLHRRVSSPVAPSHIREAQGGPHRATEG